MVTIILHDPGGSRQTHKPTGWTGATYLSACFVVMEVHQRDWVLGLLPALSPVLGVHKSAGESHTEVNVVRTARPLGG